jgi:hypothetical protein
MRIEISGGIAVNMFKALDIARGRDAMRVALSGVNWEIVGGVHTFTTTDSYRLHTVAVPDSGATYEDSVLLSGDIVKAVQVAAKAAGKNGTVLLEIVEQLGVRYCNVGDGKDTPEWAGVLYYGGVPCMSNEFPTCRSIIDGANDIELPALFNGKYLAGLIDAATLWAGKDRPVTVESVHATKPGRVTSTNSVGMFTGVLMPQRGDR